MNIPPIFWHIRNRNFAGIALTGWAFINIVFQLIDSIIWGGSDVFSSWNGYGYCDLRVNLSYGAGVGILGAVAAMARRLAMIMSKRKSSLYDTRADKRKQLIIDCLFSFGPAIVNCIGCYIVQVNRYDIYQYTGCIVALDVDWLSLILCLLWTPALGLVGAFYAGLSSLAFVIYFL